MTEEVSKQEFSLGDMVLHRTWHIGYVVDVETGDNPDIIIDFPNEPNHRMSMRLARQALTKLPSDGLEALMSRQPDMIQQWIENAPLRVVATVLSDFGKSGRPSQIKDALERHHLLGDKKWETWWKQVQPELTKSSQFTYSKSSRTYTLLATVDDIPTVKPATALKRTQKATITKEQIPEVVSELEAGEKTLGNIKGEKRFRRIIKELVRRSKESEASKRVIAEALAGPVIPIRAVFRELLLQKQFPEAMEYVAELSRSIKNLIVEKPGERGGKTIKHIGAKLGLLHQIIGMITEKNIYDSTSPKFITNVHAVIDLALALCDKEIKGWREEALDKISAILFLMGKDKTAVYELAGSYLGNLREARPVRMMVTDSLIECSPLESRREIIDSILTGSLNGSLDYARRGVSRYVRREDRLTWLMARLSRIQYPFASKAVDTIAGILSTLPNEEISESARDYLLALITLASMSSKARELLESSIQHQFKVDLDRVWEDTLTGRRQFRQDDLLNSIENAALAKGDEDKQHHEYLRNDLEYKIKTLEKTLEKSNQKIASLEELTQQLRSSYRLPEKWAAFHAKKEVLESSAGYYQELFLAKDTSGDSKSNVWLLNRLRTLLHRHGATEFAVVGSRASYDPSRHELLPGTEGKGDEVTIMCPGFEWSDPSDNRIVLVRARVTGR
ncbi:hypothetical protein ES703_64761 [subsurface metagenome]